MSLQPAKMKKKKTVIPFEIQNIPLPSTPPPSTSSHKKGKVLGAISPNPVSKKAKKCMLKEQSSTKKSSSSIKDLLDKKVKNGKSKKPKMNSLEWISLNYSDDSDDDTESESDSSVEMGQVSKSSPTMRSSKSKVTSVIPKSCKWSSTLSSSTESTPKRKHEELEEYTPKRKRNELVKSPVQKQKDPDENTPVRKQYEAQRPSTDSWMRLQSRKSLPCSLETVTNSTLKTPEPSFKRKSFPLNNSPFLSPKPSSCTTDQTPYAEDNSRRRKFQRTSLPTYTSSNLVSFQSNFGFIDSHCHLDFLFNRQGYTGTYASYQKTHEDTFPKSYKGCLAVFCNPFTFRQKYKWGQYLLEENVWAAFGCHPHNAKDYDDSIEESLCAALKHPKVRALGEIGLDYSNRNGCDKEKQFEVLRRQLKIAKKKKLNVVIHCREAHEDAITIIKEILPTDYIIHLHCFTDTWEWAERWLKEFPNLFIGITNVVTFPSAECVHEVAKKIPLTRLLLETDAPYFIPRALPRTTKFSHPGMAIYVAAQIAALKDIPLEQVLKETRENTRRMYNI